MLSKVSSTFRLPSPVKVLGTCKVVRGFIAFMRSIDPGPQWLPTVLEVGRRSVVVTGDITQVDLPNGAVSGLALRHLDRDELDEVEVAGVEVDPVVDLERDLLKWRELAMRTAADLENYRKRAVREKEEARKQAACSLLEDLLPVVR